MQNPILVEAYRLLFKEEPSSEMNVWTLAKIVHEALNPEVVGEDLAKDCIFQVYNWIPIDYSNPVELARARSAISLAESNARSFFWPTLPNEVSPDLIRSLEYDSRQKMC